MVEQKETFLMTFRGKLILLEEIILCFSVKLINAQLEHLQTSGSLLTKKQMCKYHR